MKATGGEEEGQRVLKKIGISFLRSSAAPGGQTLSQAEPVAQNNDFISLRKVEKKGT